MAWNEAFTLPYRFDSGQNEQNHSYISHQGLIYEDIFNHIVQLIS